MILAMVSILGCAQKPIVETKTVYVPIPVKLPEKPVIPKIPGNKMECLSEDTKDDLLKRDLIMKAYIADLESTIESTH